LGLTNTNKPAERVGVFGGSFDPPHVGHGALARAALGQLNLDVLYIVPTGQAWHKTRTLTAAQHRLAMAKLAFQDMARVVVDRREIQRTGPSYTIDTLLELQAEHPRAQLFLLLGMDQAQALPNWHRYLEVLQLAIICVAVRADSAGAMGTFDISLPFLPSFQRLEMPPMDVSATDLRRRLAAHQNVAPLVFEPVARYIDHHHLYRLS
jgi:nicotinate-nucleotide adenylyltransferase